jgi:hypothetical protein
VKEESNLEMKTNESERERLLEMIEIEEDDEGFRVALAEDVSVESPPNDLMQDKVNVREKKEQNARERILDSKIESWTSDRLNLICKLLLSIFYQIDRTRSKSFIIIVEMDELDKGFRVERAEEASFESLSSELKQDISDTHSNVYCTMIFKAKDANNGKIYATVIPFDMGEESGLAVLQERSDFLEKDEIIKELNKETLNVTYILSKLYRIKAYSKAKSIDG